jgi:hypothetical protein
MMSVTLRVDPMQHQPFEVPSTVKNSGTGEQAVVRIRPSDCNWVRNLIRLQPPTTTGTVLSYDVWF